MDDLTKYKTNLDKTEAQLAQYDTNLPSQIQTEYQKAYTPLLQQATDVTKNLMSDYLGRIMETTGLAPGMAGTTAYDLSPTQKMGQIGREIGYASGELMGAQKYADYLGAQMNDMYNKTLQAAQMGQQNLADQYARQMQQYQMAWQEAENEKNRAATLAASGSGGGGFNLSDYFKEPTIPTREQLIADLQNTANQIASQRGKTNTYTYNGVALGSIDDAYNRLMSNAKSMGLNVNPEWLWQQLGNKPKEISPSLAKYGAYWTPTLP